MIRFLEKEIKEKILKMILITKYFLVIFDCILDLCHEKQMSIIISYMEVEDASKVKVEEFFLGFIKVNDMSGLKLFQAT